MTSFDEISDDGVHGDDDAERAARVISHLDRALDATMLDAMQGVWAVLERASVDAPSHARAVRARLFWQSLTAADDTVAAAMPLEPRAWGWGERHAGGDASAVEPTSPWLADAA